MKDRDRDRFRDNITWFNQFFDGIRQIYEFTVTLLPEDFFNDGFSLNSGNFYFPRYKVAPSIPRYYGMTIEGRNCALQMVSVIDAEIFAPAGPLNVEPSMVIVAHTQTEKYSWVSDYALKVIKCQDLEQVDRVKDILWGRIEVKYPAYFFAFQVEYDRFSGNLNLQSAVSQYIVAPILENLKKGFKAT